MKFCLRILLLFFLVTGTVTQDFDLFDALDDPPPTPAKPKEPPKPPKDPGLDGGLDLSDAFGPDEPQTKKPEKPNSGDSGDAGFDLGDALKPDPNAKPDKPAVKPPSGGGGGRAMDPQGGADPPQEAGSGPLAGIISAVGVALVGAASSYFAYQKKKLCFKMQGGADPESGKGHQGTHSEPQALSNLLQSN
ncbi:CD99 molecule isoform X3 [Archocentrus centrarchus]|uniref:CD99 molecule isoform X3 n=1 Tax=Archocentrus centrarchus TaxID=63155 RepID=UPI0011E9C74A|nr:CD99 antigen-like protein 2 isoform X3 [Archocentrus centrarchus]